MQPLVIKVGGALLDSVVEKAKLFETIATLAKQDIAVILVHGGGCLVDEWINAVGLENQKLDGLRVTPKSQIGLVSGALAGAANKQLVANAKLAAVNAVGLSLCDGNSVKASYLDPQLGQVGTCEIGDAALVNTLLATGFTPFIASIADDGEGRLLNVNADQAAQVIAQLVGGKLILLSDVPGVLDADKQLIKQLTPTHANALIAQGVIAGGMKVKVATAFETAKALDGSIVIASWKQPDDLLAFATGGTCGTTIEP
ncbi:acetylglutamate kinase [Psychrobium sp. MM17-31]|uniref:acetylglutamate kinase n=1 Tax=Psychrobium sp. MM17-31 TaxID=2917758 RepID=UPI001EF57A7E|nr:acetylglutamate kinase [Psychrobium sp. MM17-31]MCG7533085.1 acetylglutamate kinase [Psychrobium sp. MM17-31]